MEHICRICFAVFAHGIHHLRPLLIADLAELLWLRVDIKLSSRAAHPLGGVQSRVFLRGGYEG